MKPRSKLLTPALALVLSGALACFAPSAHAEEGGARGDIKKKIQEKMEKILKLMRENEEALLKLSTGKAGTTRKVDVEVPPGEAGSQSGGSGSSGSGSSGSGSSGSGGSGSGGSGSGSTGSESGEQAGKEIEKLLEDVARKGGSIPDELKQLVQMIPLYSSSSGGQSGSQQKPEDSDASKRKQGPDEKMNARDARKQLEEEQRRKEMAKKKGQEEPKSGDRSPTNPADRTTDGGKPKDADSSDPRRNDVPAWFTALPPEVRDSLAGGRAEDVPEKYRKLIRTYSLWLQKNQKSRR